MTATNKAFAYVFNTTSEDQKVSRMLSCWDPSKKPAVSLMSWFDSATKNQAIGLAGLLFQTSINTQDPEKHINDRVIDVLVAALIQRFPQVIDRYPMCYATRMRECLFALNITKTEVLAWSSELQKESTLRGEDVTADGAETITKEERLINHQICVIGELVSLNQELAKRLSAMEERITGVECGEQLSRAPGGVNRLPNVVVQDAITPKTKSCGSKASARSPVAIWFEWYDKTPRLWQLCDSRQKKSTYKQDTNFMKLFLPNGFALDPSADTSSDDVLRIGQEAESNLYSFFEENGIKRKNGSSVLKHLRSLHRDGKLDAHITAYAARVNIRGISDPAPSHLKQLFISRSRQ